MGFQGGGCTRPGPLPAAAARHGWRPLVSWVGLDILLCPFEHSKQVVARAKRGREAWESLEVLIEAAGCGPDFEVRTTVVPGTTVPTTLVEVARSSTRRARLHALQQASALRGRAASSTSWHPAGTDAQSAWPERTRLWAGSFHPTARRLGRMMTWLA